MLRSHAASNLPGPGHAVSWGSISQGQTPPLHWQVLLSRGVRAAACWEQAKISGYPLVRSLDTGPRSPPPSSSTECIEQLAPNCVTTVFTSELI